jgi:DNA (cytosine-5)-methyltransferase 1
MRFGSVCSGIEAASVAWHPLGWKAAWLSEIEPFPCAVLKHHYPDVPNLGDMTTLPDRIFAGEVEAPDVFCGGTPCQAFSVAGLRNSLDDARGNLSLTFCEIANAIDHVRLGAGLAPAIVFWENVPGVLSTSDNAFGCFLAGIAGEDQPLEPPGGRWTNAGYVSGPKRAVAWRILDAQYFGVAQRRRRVFVVASARTGFDPAAVLFEFNGVRRDTAPSREAGEKPAGTFTARTTSGGGFSTDFECDGGVIQAFGGNNQAGPIDVATARNACASASGRLDFETETFLVQQPVAFQQTADCLTAAYGTKWNGNASATNGSLFAAQPVAIHEAPYVASVCPTLRAGGNQTGGDRPPGTDVDTADSLIAFHPTQDSISSTDGTTHAMGTGSAGGCATVAVAVPHTDIMPTMTCGGGHAASHNQVSGQMRDAYMVPTTTMQVRRLTPVECERLQGFPDDYLTQVPWRGKSTPPDGPMYKALGNSWAVPVVAWIGRRIKEHIGD